MEILNYLKRLLFVPRCALCHRETEGDCLCRSCRLRYEKERKRPCAICGYRYDRCRCLPQFASPYIKGYARLTHYSEESAAGQLILAAKDRANGELYDFLASEMAICAKQNGFAPDVIAYIPCSEHSFAKKGFDHGKRLAKALGKKMHLPTADCFVRRMGSEQKTLGAALRLENSKNTLFPKKGGEKAVAGKRVLLVDDILTTGASALVASVHLNELGADEICFLSFGGR